MKDLMMLYGVTLGRRYTKKQKAYFINEIFKTYGSFGFPAELKIKKSSILTINNIVAGNLQNARSIFVTSYDTPSRALLPHFKYYPFHTSKNMKTENLNLIVRIILACLFAFATYICLKTFFTCTAYKVFFSILSALMAFFTLSVTRAKPNRYNFNRNSASIAVMTKIAENCKNNKDIAFVFLDQSVSSFDGLKALREICGDKNIVVMDCISCGEKLLVAHRGVTNKQAENLVESAKKVGVEVSDRLYSDKKAENNILHFNRRMLYLVSGTVKDKEFVVYNTKSKKDIEVDIKRLDCIAQALTNFATD